MPHCGCFVLGLYKWIKPPGKLVFSISSIEFETSDEIKLNENVDIIVFIFQNYYFAK